MTFRNRQRHFLSDGGKGTERHCDVLKFNQVTGWLWRLASDRFSGWFHRQEQPMRNPLMGHQRDSLGTHLHDTDLRFVSLLPVEYSWNDHSIERSATAGLPTWIHRISLVSHHLLSTQRQRRRYTPHRSDMEKLGKSRVKQVPGKNRLRQQALARNLARGLSPVAAMIKAGYSPTTADKKAHLVVRQPVVQSLLTESCERIIKEHNKTFDDLLRPFVKALDAHIVVKRPSAGRAVQTTVVDHPTRMAAATHLIGLFLARGKEVQEEEAGLKGPPFVYQIKFVESSKEAKPVMINQSASRSSPAETLTPQVSFLNSKR